MILLIILNGLIIFKHNCICIFKNGFPNIYNTYDLFSQQTVIDVYLNKH